MATKNTRKPGQFPWDCSEADAYTMGAADMRNGKPATRYTQRAWAYERAAYMRGRNDQENGTVFAWAGGVSPRTTHGSKGEEARQMSIQFDIVTYQQQAREHQAVLVTWPAIEAALGHEHACMTPDERTGYEADDDRALVALLLAAGAPAWVATEGGAVDETGWYVIGPEIEECEQP